MIYTSNQNELSFSLQPSALAVQGFPPSMIQYAKILQKLIYKDHVFPISHTELITFYHFNKQLHALFSEILLSFQTSLNSLIAHYFCIRFDHSPESYLDIEHYAVEQIHPKHIMQLIHKISTSYQVFTEMYHLSPSYNSTWHFTHTLPFDITSDIFYCSKSTIQTLIMKHYNLADQREFCHIVRFLLEFHIYCQKQQCLPAFRSTHNNCLVTVLCCLHLVIPQKEFRHFLSDFYQLVYTFLKNFPILDAHMLFELMKIPQNSDSLFSDIFPNFIFKTWKIRIMLKRRHF